MHDNDKSAATDTRNPWIRIRLKEAAAMKKRALLLTTLALLLGVFGLGYAPDSVVRADDRNSFGAQLEGFQETPAIATTGQGTLRLTLTGPTAMQFDLNYSGLKAPTTLAHIHLGQRGVAGGVMVFFCGGGGRPACPPSGPVTGTVTAADVIGPTGQGVVAGDFGEVVRALRAGVVYGNVHSTQFPSGEIRGQLRGSGERDNNDR